MNIMTERRIIWQIFDIGIYMQIYEKVTRNLIYMLFFKVTFIQNTVAYDNY